MTYLQCIPLRFDVCVVSLLYLSLLHLSFKVKQTMLSIFDHVMKSERDTNSEAGSPVVKAGHVDLSGFCTSRNKNAIFFSPNFKSAAHFSAPVQEGNLFFLSGRSARKKIHNFPIKSSHLCRTSRHVWLSSSTCDHCCAYQLICIMTISTYTTGARAEMSRQLGSRIVKK